MEFPTRREWRRHPETRRRVARARSEAGVLRVERPELAIIDRELWDAVQAKLAGHAQAYKSRAIPHRRTDYLLSGILRCGHCGELMQVCGGSPHRYYRCSANRKRGATACPNALSVRESIARDRILDAIREALASPAAVAYVRKRVAVRLGELSRQVGGELAEREARLARVDTRIRSIVAMQVDGDGSPYVAEMRRDLEAQATDERAAIASLRARASARIRLPDVAEIARRVHALGALADPANVEPARGALRSYLKGGAIRCSPEPGGFVARAELLPLAVMLDSPESGNAAGKPRCLRSVARGRYAGRTTQIPTGWHPVRFVCSSSPLR